MEKNLKEFTAFPTRYYNSDSGKASADWLFEKIFNYTKELASEEVLPLILVREFHHPWRQNSIVSFHIIFLRVH
jgi:bacterial leucyl aminopeptidase